MNEKENMVACIPSADEWQEIVRSVREAAAQTAVEYMDRESNGGMTGET